MKNVYLAGAINGCTDAQANNWRTQMKQLLPGCRIFDPMSRDYRGKEDENVSSIVEGDKADICECGFVVVNAERPSWGTAMEVLYAHERGRRVVVIMPPKAAVSPWLRYHAYRVVKSLKAAATVVRQSPEFWVQK